MNGQRIHFMGAGGIGVSALAELAHTRGAVVSACDRAENAQTAHLRRIGIPIHIGHDPAHVHDADLLIYTSAVPPDHPERTAARASERRGTFLARFLNERGGIGVAGAHGKTTTTCLLGQIVVHAGLDPSVFVGGVSAAFGGANLRVGKGKWFVSELDESDGSFLEPRLAVAVVTNIESDHLAHYGTEERLREAFRQFADGVRETGILVAGIDSPDARNLFNAHAGRKISFGFAHDADLRAADHRFADGRQMFRVMHQGNDLGDFSLPLPGRHNVQNALGALAAALSTGVPAETAKEALARAVGVERRLERLGTIAAGVPFYSDYAHHPTEIRAALEALRQLHDGPVLTIFQPHLYSRTRDYTDAFGHALTGADLALVLDIYPAREAPLPGVTSELVVNAVRRAGGMAEGPFPLADAGKIALEHAGHFAAVVFLGAGDIDDAARRVCLEVRF